MNSKVLAHKFIKTYKFIQVKKYLLFFLTFLLVLFALPTLFLTQKSYQIVEDFLKGWFYPVFLIHSFIAFFCVQQLVFEIYFATTSKRTLFNKNYSFGIVLFLFLFFYFIWSPSNSDVIPIPITKMKAKHFGLNILMAEALILVVSFCVFSILYRIKELFEKEVLAKKEREENGLGQEDQGYHHPKKSVLLTAKLAFLFVFFLIFCLALILLVLPFFVADYERIVNEEKTKILTIIYYFSALLFFPLFFFALPPISSYLRAKGHKIRPLLKMCMIIVITVFSPLKGSPLIPYFDYLPLGVFVLLYGIFPLLSFYCCIDLVIRYQQLLETEKGFKVER